MIGEADQFGPCDQICCCHDDFQPCLVRVERVEREITQPGGLGLTDAVLHPGVLAVAQFQAGDLSGHHPSGVSVMNPVTRCPSESVNRSCAPGWGRSLRRISRVPSGHADRSTRSVASATHAPSRIPRSASMAGYHTAAVVSTSVVSRMRVSIAVPKENPTPDLRQAAAKA